MLLIVNIAIVVVLRVTYPTKEHQIIIFSPFIIPLFLMHT